tara:strand:+ start:14 stop:574 length:561 start_codon:yes stop_codon:yes gene_type:complete
MCTTVLALAPRYPSCCRELVRELDDSEEQARTLRLKLMEKDNLLGTMLHREKIIDIDLGERKQELAAINAHIQGIEARVDRLKKERRSMELTSQKHQYDSAANTLKMQVNDVQQVSSALESRVQHLNERITRQVQQEATALRRSLQPRVAGGDERDEGAATAIASAAGNVPSPPVFMQRSSRRLRA